MMPFYALLTNTEAFDLLQKLPIFIGAFAAVVLFVAFVIGCAKGFRKMSWGGCVWIAASGGYFLLERAFGEENPLKPVLSNVIEGEQTLTFMASFLCALACVVVALALQGVCSLLFRPRMKLVDKEKCHYTRDKAATDDNCDDYEKFSSRKVVVRKGMGKPSFFGRVLGGLIGAMNMAALLAALLSLALLAVCATRLNEGFFAPAFQNEYMPRLQDYALRYTFDFLMIGCILKTARSGFEKGFMQSLRFLAIGVGRLLGVGFAFYAPFSSMALSVEEGGVRILHSYVYRCIEAAKMMGLPETYAPLVGKLLAGVLLCVLVLIVFAVFSFFFKRLTEAIDRLKVMRMIDGMFACVIYLAIGAAICAAIGSVFYALGAYGIFDMNTVLSKTSLVKKMIDACGVYIQPMIDSFNDMVAGFISNR